jgi:hypothetical protein
MSVSLFAVAEALNLKSGACSLNVGWAKHSSAPTGKAIWEYKI